MPDAVLTDGSVVTGLLPYEILAKVIAPLEEYLPPHEAVVPDENDLQCLIMHGSESLDGPLHVPR